jgi:uncharacterized protein YutE (UPF0331/DUF86 family)
MPDELILKKLEQIEELLGELEKLLAAPFGEFQKDITKIRAAERNFQLIVDLAADINTQILLEREKKTPDTYRQSFLALAREGIVEDGVAEHLSQSAGLRNILVHEYDFEEDYKKFYESAKKFIAPYREYAKIIHLLVSERQ